MGMPHYTVELSGFQTIGLIACSFACGFAAAMCAVILVYCPHPFG